MDRRTLRLVERATLLRASRPLLARLLAPGRDFLAARDVRVEALADSDRDDPSPIDALHAALHAPPPPPEALAERLRTFDLLATENGAAAILRLDAEAMKLPRGTLADADLALTVMLDHPAIAEEAGLLCAPAHDPARPFTEYQPKDPARAAWDPERHDAALGEAIGGRLLAHDRTRLCHVRRTDTAEAHVFELELGDRPKVRDVVDPHALTTRAVTDITAQRAYARLAKDDGALAIRAWPPVVHDVVRRAFGQVLAGDQDFFRAEDVYDLSPFLRPREALSVEGLAPLRHVELRVLWMKTPLGGSVPLGRARGDMLAIDLGPLLDVAVAYCKVVAVRLYLTLEGRDRASKLVIKAPPKGKPVVEIDRDDAELVEVAREYLIARGVLRVTARAHADAAQ